jgi:hypothetical protein
VSLLHSLDLTLESDESFALIAIPLVPIGGVHVSCTP